MSQVQRLSLSPLPWKKMAFIILAILCLTPVISSPVALVSGFLFAHFLGNPFTWAKGKLVSNLLKVAVVGLGFGMNVHEALATSQSGFVMIICSISFTLLGGILLGKLLKLDKVAAYLIAVGTAICGGSAIAAVSPVVNAKEQDISMALGVVFLLNSVALILFPLIGNLLEMGQADFGLWSAIAIHDTSSVVGAANAYGLEALEIATTVKLSRALWIIPVSFFSMIIFKGKGKSVKIPWFILFFVIAMLLNTWFSLPFSDEVVGVARALMVLTLFLIGMNLSVEKIKAAGLKPLLHGFLLWVLVSSISLMAVLF